MKAPPLEVRALFISLLALAVPVAVAFLMPEAMADVEALLWLVGLVPAFLFAYQRGWRGAGIALALGMVLLSLTYAATTARGQTPPEVLGPVVVAWVIIALGIGWMAEAFHLERRRAESTLIIDPATGLPTRAYLDHYLETEWDAARRGRPLSLVVFGMDAGRPAESAIRHFAQVVRSNTRQMNVSARLEESGSRFVTVLGDSDDRGAVIFALRVLRVFREAQEEWTASAGVARADPSMTEVGELVEAAGEALEDARREGGDRVRVAGLPFPDEEAADATDALLRSVEPDGAVTEGEDPTRRILLVGEAAATKVVLEGVDGPRVKLERARGLREAMERIHMDPDVLLLDLDLPGGLQLLDALRDRGATTQVVGIAGDGDADSAVDALHRGVVHCLRAPLDVPAIREAVRSAARLRDETRRRSIEKARLSDEYRARTREVERTLAETEARYRAVVEEIREVVFRVDAKGRWTFLNRAWEYVSGREVEETLGTPFHDVFHPDDRALSRDLVEDVLRGTIPWAQRRLRLLPRPGDPGEVWVDLSISVLRASTGETEGAQGIIVDVGKRKELEDQLHQAQKMEAVGRLAGGIAHDFNNILTALRGHAELLLGDASVPESTRSDLEEIVRSADRAAVLTRRLVAFSRNQVIAPRSVDLGRHLDDMEEMLRRLIGEDVAVEIRVAPDAGPVRADPGQVEQLLVNLAVNAREAMPRGGRLTVDVSGVEIPAAEAREMAEEVRPGRYTRLTVTDTGCGIEPDLMDRIFEPFFSTKKGEGASGLGLAISYGIARQGGGFIRVESTPGEGATFRVYLPEEKRSPGDG